MLSTRIGWSGDVLCERDVQRFVRKGDLANETVEMKAFRHRSIILDNIRSCHIWLLQMSVHIGHFCRRLR